MLLESLFEIWSQWRASLHSNRRVSKRLHQYGRSIWISKVLHFCGNVAIWEGISTFKKAFHFHQKCRILGTMKPTAIRGKKCLVVFSVLSLDVSFIKVLVLSGYSGQNQSRSYPGTPWCREVERHCKNLPLSNASKLKNTPPLTQDLLSLPPP